MLNTIVDGLRTIDLKLAFVIANMAFNWLYCIQGTFLKGKAIVKKGLNNWSL